jgi:adenylate kinase
MEKGQLVPDDLLIGLIRERIAQEDCRKGFVLDGFPRTVPQAEGLEAMTGEGGESVVIEVEVPRQELMRRLSGRRWCPTCQATYHVETSPPKHPGLCDRDATPLVQRDDDKEAVVARRLAEYDERTRPLIRHYQARSRLRRVDGHRPVNEVFEELKGILAGARR